MKFHDAHAERQPSLDWPAKCACAIARGEAILARSPDPADPIDAPEPSHVLARLQEERVRSAIVAVLDVDCNVKGPSQGLVRAEEIRSACEPIVTTMDLSYAVGNAEFHAAMAAIRPGYRRPPSR